MSAGAAALLVAIMYVLHQDVWFWREARPLVFGFLPIGLFYHAVFTAACAPVLWALVTFAWPGHLEASRPEPKLGPAGGPTNPDDGSSRR
jgi:hypothetical protein